MADYVYATACIRSEEPQLLTEEQFRQMTESKNFDDICKTLQDAGYGGEGNAVTVANYEQRLKEKETQIFGEVEELSKEDPVFNIFRYPADYNNIKVLLKAEALGVDRRDILMNSGTIAPEDMIRFVNERNRLMLTENMYAAVEEAIDTHARTKDPQVIDFICDKYCYMDINEEAEKSGNEFVKGYVRLLIDTVNIKTAVRLARMNKIEDLFPTLFIEGGNIDEQVYTFASDEDMKQVAEKFQPYAIYTAIRDGGEEVEREGTYTKLEKLCDNALMDYVREAKFITFGIEPLIAYLISRQMEIKCIRILMTGKIAHMDPERIRERMRETYE